MSICKPYTMCLQIQILIFQLQDIPDPVGVRAEATADNTSITVLWEWSLQGVVVCVNNVTVDYRPDGGSLMMYTVDNTTTTNATLPNLQCNTKYTVWVQAKHGRTGIRSPASTISLPARGMYLWCNLLIHFTVVHHLQLLPLLLRSLLSSKVAQVSG